MKAITPALQQAISNMTLLCMKYSSEKFEINMSLYPTKNELNIYVFKGGYLHAWRNPEQRIQKHRIEPYRVCRRLNILRDYSDEKTKLYPRN